MQCQILYVMAMGRTAVEAKAMSPRSGFATSSPAAMLEASRPDHKIQSCRYHEATVLERHQGSIQCSVPTNRFDLRYALQAIVTTGVSVALDPMQVKECHSSRQWRADATERLATLCLRSPRPPFGNETRARRNISIRIDGRSACPSRLPCLDEKTESPRQTTNGHNTLSYPRHVPDLDSLLS